MRVMLTAVVAVLVLAGPALAQSQNAPNQGSQITCSQIDDAQHYVDGLGPGPNTRAAQKHLEAAKAASQGGNDRQCVQELGRVNYYARRSAAADKRVAEGHGRRPEGHVLCADAMHQDRPGGSDYHGPPIAGCRKVM